MYKNVFIEEQENTRGIVHLWDDEAGYSSFPFSKFNYAYKPSSHGSFLTMTGERCEKVFRYKKDTPGLFESDVPRETRVLTDLYLHNDTPSVGHTVLYFDIEVSMKNGIPTTDSPNNEIISIAAFDTKSEIYKVFVLRNAPTNSEFLSSETHIDGPNKVAVHYYDTEIELLKDFVHYWSELAPTIITGWNIDKFDIPYLYHRIQQQMGPAIADMLSPIGLVRYSTFRSKYCIAGVSSLDYFDLYKKFTYTQQPSYRLHAIGMLEVGMGKVEYQGSLDALYENDLDKFIEYNVQDVKIVVEMDKKLKLIELVRGICHVGHVPYEDYCYSSKFLEGTILTYLHRKDIVATNKPADGRAQMQARKEADDEGFEGAYVKPPLPGLYEWVYSLDLQSLYPSIIMSLNISPETKRGKVHQWDLYKHLNKSVESYVVVMDDTPTEVQMMTPEQFLEFLQKTQYTISSNGILYDTKVRGIIPEILNKWFAERKEYKKLMDEHRKAGDDEQAEFYNRRQHIQKIFLNSLYGVLGLPIFRFYDLDNAAAVTLSGQDVIKTSAKFLSKQYQQAGVPEKSADTLRRYKEVLDKEVKRERIKASEVTGLLDPNDHCLYVDTDSLYFSAIPLFRENCDPQQETIEIAKAMEVRLNNMYDTMCWRLFNVGSDDHRFHIKGEKIAKSALWLAKKRYALLTTYDLESNVAKEKMVVKGLDIVRSSFPPIFREFMTSTTKLILSGGTKEEVDGKVTDFVNNLSQYSYIQVARNTTVQGIIKYANDSEGFSGFAKGSPAHVKAAISYNRLLTELKLNTKYPMISDGEKIKYVYIKPNPYKLPTMAFKGEDDPPEIIEFIKTYIDYNKLFEAELKDKLEDYYLAMNWGILPTDQNTMAASFFSF
jgi:DNA polymerase elongation subunit (family B)